MHNIPEVESARPASAAGRCAIENESGYNTKCAFEGQVIFEKNVQQAKVPEGVFVIHGNFCTL